MKAFWNQRYQQAEYVYGVTPNLFFKEELDKLNPGNIILPCEGEGRNAVYAASKGWNVSAFDMSEAGKEKASLLAKQNNATIHYTVSDVMAIEYDPLHADILVLIFAHFPPEIRTAAHRKMIDWVKPGGKIIIEAFNPLQLNNSSGGPKDISMLYTIEMLQEDFKDLNIESIEYKKIILNEGAFHQGEADVIQMIASKKSN